MIAFLFFLLPYILLKYGRNRETDKKKLKDRGMSNAEFARRINTHVRNFYDIFKRKSIDTELLKKISLVLEFDFFNYYKLCDPGREAKEKTVVYHKKENSSSKTDKIKLMELKN